MNTIKKNLNKLILLSFFIIGCNDRSDDSKNLDLNGLDLSQLLLGKITFVATQSAFSLDANLEGTSIILNTKVNGSPARFIIDSGSTANVISSATAARLGIEKKSSEDATVLTVCSVVNRIDIYVVDKFETFGIEGNNSTFLSTGDDDFFNQAGVDGLLGQPFLASIIMEVDYQNRIFNAFDSTQFSVNDIGLSNDFKIINSPRLITEDLKVAGMQEGPSIIDTGNALGLVIINNEQNRQILNASTILKTGEFGGIGCTSKATVFENKAEFPKKFKFANEKIVFGEKLNDLNTIGVLYLAHFHFFLDVRHNKAAFKKQPFIEDFPREDSMESILSNMKLLLIKDFLRRHTGN